jgi:hypothetical protein
VGDQFRPPASVENATLERTPEYEKNSAKLAEMEPEETADKKSEGESPRRHAIRTRGEEPMPGFVPDDRVI